MKKLFLVLSAFVLVLGSCSKSEDAMVVVEPDSVSENLDNILIKQIIESNGTVVTKTTTFTYDGKKILKTEDTQGVKVVFTYVDDLITKKVTTSNNSLLETEDFTYNSANKLIKYSSLTSDSSVAKIENYIDNSNDNVNDLIFNNIVGNTIIAGISFEDGFVTYLGNEVIKNGYQLYTNPPFDPKLIFNKSYLFDTKKSFYKNITGFKNIAYAGFKNSYTGYDRNVRKITNYKKNTDTNVETTSTITWTYVYSTNEYPASSIKTAVSTTGTTTTTNISYVY